ncbi:efflux RND transporter periplasmic adaptor subunit [Desulfolithobacter sp.]
MKPSLFIKMLGVSCLLILTASTFSWATEEKNRTDPPTPVEVTVSEVKITKLVDQTEVVGTVEAVQQARIAAKVSGTISEMPIVLGSRVKKGDLLVKIAAEEISARVLQAQAQLEQARRNLEREKKLLAKNASTRETVKSMQDMYAVARAAYREARSMLRYTTITAPFTGVVTRKMASVGDLATPGTPLLQLENSDRLQVVAAIPEALVLAIKLGDTLPISIPAPKLELTGTVAEIAPAADKVTRTSPVKFDIPTAQGLRTGQFARVRLPAGATRTMFVPVSAVVPFGQMDKVFVVDNNIARLRLVRTGMQKGDQLEILAGLEPGDLVVTDNNRHLVDGAPLILRK